MNEKYKNLLNPTESIQKAMPAFVETFVSYYGEEERERITKTFNDMLIIGYTDPSNISSVINNSNKEKSAELINKFLNKMTSSKEEQDKLRKVLFADYKLQFFNLQPIYEYMSYKENNDVSNYQKEKLVSFLQKFYPETTVNNLDEMIKSKVFKNLDIIIPFYKEILNEYQEYEKEIKPYLDYVDECNRIKNKLETEYQIKYIEQIKSLFTDKEYEEIRDKINNKKYYFISMMNSKTKNFVPSSLNGTALIDAFSKENEEKLKNGSTWQKKSIQDDRIRYFKNFGINLGINATYEDYLNNEKVKEILPKKELANKLIDIRNNLYTEMMNKYYQSIPEYKKT